MSPVCLFGLFSIVPVFIPALCKSFIFNACTIPLGVFFSRIFTSETNFSCKIVAICSALEVIFRRRAFLQFRLF